MTSTSVSRAPDVDEDVAAIQRVLELYSDLTNARDAKSVATQVYRAPVLLVTPDGEHVAFQDAAALTEGFAAYLDDEAKAGRTRSAIDRMHVSLLCDSVALALVDYSYAGSGGASKDGWIYMFQKNAGDWRAVSAAPRDLT